VLEGREKQLFVTMPARKSRGGQMRDIAHPLNRETRQAIEERGLEEYENAIRLRAVPEPKDRKGERSGRSGIMDRLAGKLFAEDYWTADVDRRDLEAE